MLREKWDNKYNFKSIFNTKTGFYLRTGVIDESGHDTGVDPFMTSFPELIDIGIMGHCIHGLTGKCKESGVQCYQHGDISHSHHMTFEDYRSIIDECKGKTFQVALGGCGDPDQHPDFEKILAYTVDNDIVPNFTTSGFGLTEDKIKLCKQYCGAVAVSWYRSKYTIEAVKNLVDAGIITNIHYVIGDNTIDEAIKLLETNGFPNGINAVIFLLHKPVGLGQSSNVLSKDDERVAKFFKLIDTKKFQFKIGFDSCTIPGILTFMKNVDKTSIDTCEAARWSMYITSDMKGLPCSFDNQEQRYAVDIKEAGSIQAVWDSEQFNQIRKKFECACPDCKNRKNCLGGCPLMRGIQLCEAGNGG